MKSLSRAVTLQADVTPHVMPGANTRLLQAATLTQHQLCLISRDMDAWQLLDSSKASAVAHSGGTCTLIWDITPTTSQR